MGGCVTHDQFLSVESCCASRRLRDRRRHLATCSTIKNLPHWHLHIAQLPALINDDREKGTPDFDFIPERMVLALRFRLIEILHQRHHDDEASHHVLKLPPSNARDCLVPDIQRPSAPWPVRGPCTISRHRRRICALLRPGPSACGVSCFFITSVHHLAIVHPLLRAFVTIVVVRS